jgi:acylphosphatase
MARTWQCLISGRVQRVGYRHFARLHAHALGIHGTIRNLSDGSVEIIAQTEEELFNHYIELLRKGPSGSSVKSVQITEISDPEINFQDFKIVF